MMTNRIHQNLFACLAAVASFPWLVSATTVDFIQVSSPVGIVDQPATADTNTTVTTISAPLEDSGFRFTHWQEVTGGSSRDLLGRALELNRDTVVGTAFLEVGEFVADASGVGLGQKQVETDPFFAPPITTDAIEFPILQKKLIIEKDILLQGSAVGDFAELEMFEQRFSQVPEPDGALSLVVGAAGLWALSRRRAARARG